MKDCTRCIMEHGDGLVLIEPTIYVIEGDFYRIGDKAFERLRDTDEELEEEPPF